MAKINIPFRGERITSTNGRLDVPDNPIIPYIVGDGIGPDIWTATAPVLNTAVSLAYNNKRQLQMMEVFAGNKANETYGSSLPSDTIDAFSKYLVGIKGPLSTPVGGGHRSINVTLRSVLDLYVCMRPIEWFSGCPSPMRHPERVNMVVFRENTEDIYAGIEFQSGSQQQESFLTWLKSTKPEAIKNIRFPDSSNFAIKPISRQGTERFIRAAINYAVKNKRSKLTLVHKGNIMKFTEGAFANWGYDLAEKEFGELVFTTRQYSRIQGIYGENDANKSQEEAIQSGKLLINDVITDAAFEQTLTRPEEFEVIATTNLNGDYLSDALSAQVGGLGISPGVNLNAEENIAIFEATHGTAPTLAGKNLANPSSLILSGAMMLNHIGWYEAANLIRAGIRKTLEDKIFTFDFYRANPDSTQVSTTEYAQVIIRNMHKEMQF